MGSAYKEIQHRSVRLLYKTSPKPLGSTKSFFSGYLTIQHLKLDFFKPWSKHFSKFQRAAALIKLYH